MSNLSTAQAGSDGDEEQLPPSRPDQAPSRSYQAGCDEEEWIGLADMSSDLTEVFITEYPPEAERGNGQGKPGLPVPLQFGPSINPLLGGFSGGPSPQSQTGLRFCRRARCMHSLGN